jgi:hypothetical protein
MNIRVIDKDFIGRECSFDLAVKRYKCADASFRVKLCDVVWQMTVVYKIENQLKKFWEKNHDAV